MLSISCFQISLFTCQLQSHMLQLSSTGKQVIFVACNFNFSQLILVACFKYIVVNAGQ